METYFAPAERADAQAIRDDIDFASKNPIITGVLQAGYGLLAVLNAQRQILAVNDAFLKALGISNAVQVLGLRPGEAVGCIHAHEMAGGCGTSRFCPTCGAAIAIVASLAEEEPVERKCVIAVSRNGDQVDLCFRVCAKRIQFQGQYLIILFLQDISESEKWAEIQRAFFHDISNTISGLQGAVELLLLNAPDGSRDLLHKIRLISSRLVKEVGIQRMLANRDGNGRFFSKQRISVANLIDEITGVMDNHPAARDKHLSILEIPHRIYLNSDISLLLRILTNMLVNAFEATAAGGEVKFWLEQDPYAVIFCVWNRETVPVSVAPRIFQRYFSTKPGSGRGLGTYMMKRFGEEILGGKVSFSSSAQVGTIFRLKLPLA